MTASHTEARTIFEDARRMHAAALEQLEVGDIRDAAEKAWCATKRATDALILARTGEEPTKSPATGQGLDSLAERDPDLKGLVGRYYSRQETLHGRCFYLGLCDPMATTVRRIRETAQYIEDSEAMASE